MREITYNQVFPDMTDFFVTLINDVMTEFDIPKKEVREMDFMSELGRRVFLITTEDEYTVRLWNVWDNSEEIKVEYSVFKKEGDEEVELLP